MTTVFFFRCVLLFFFAFSLSLTNTANPLSPSLSPILIYLRISVYIETRINKKKEKHAGVFLFLTTSTGLIDLDCGWRCFSSFRTDGGLDCVGGSLLFFSD